LKKLAIISTHPIQYNAPLFEKINDLSEFETKVFYTWPEGCGEFEDPSFKKVIKWDIDLTKGYKYEIIKNSNKVTNKTFWNIDNPELLESLKKYKPSHVLIYGWNFRSHFRIIRKFSNKALLGFRGDSTILDFESRFKSLLKKVILKTLFRNIDHFLISGKANQAYCMQYGAKKNQLIDMPHAIDNNRYSTDYVDKTINELQARIGITEKDMVILFVGKFERKKNPEILLDAFEELIRDSNYSKTHLLFVGNGQLEDQLKERSKNDKNIHFLPFQNQKIMPCIYRLGSVFCLPSSGPGETWGLAANEAIACGLPVVISDKCGSHVDLAEYQKICTVFKNGSAKSLTEALQTKLTAKNSKIDLQKETDAFTVKYSYTSQLKGIKIFMKI
jgi:glycosyltransferase involved in cell wall biosynthesis